MTTTTGLEDGQIIKTDELGRVLTSKVRREALLEEFDRSGMSGQAFAQWAGIKYQTFASWRQKRRRAKKKPVASQSPPEPDLQPRQGRNQSLHWVEAVMNQEPQNTASMGAGLVVHFPGGARMEVSDSRGATLVAEILRQLARSQPC
jgi:hypothetical protein